MARVKTASDEVSAIMVETRAAATGRAGQDAERWWKRAVKERRCPTCLKETRVVLEWAPVEQASLPRASAPAVVWVGSAFCVVGW